MEGRRFTARRFASRHLPPRTVVHRDIKPDNVMLSGRHALVTDFGVAKAVSEATGRQILTTVGVALGTPAHMAPEQAAADPHIDHRADIYAVGAVAYELLTGKPPFTGVTPQEILAAHVTQIPEPVTKFRESVPPALAQLVMKCLEKKAADRWQSAEELLPHLEALATPSGGVTPTGMVPTVAASSGHGSALRWAAVAGAAVVLAAVAWGLFGRGPQTDTVPVDPNSVAVLPFRVSGDPSLEYLREGMVDALYSKLTGDGGLRAVDPGTVLSAWRRAVPDASTDVPVVDAVGVAQDVGAAHVLVGSLLKTGADVTLSGALHQVPGGDEVATASVTGLADSLLIMIDRLAVQLLSLQAGEDRARVGTMSWSLEAVQAYLEGTRASREQRYLEAIGHFDRALAADSTFALPAFALAGAASSAGNTNTEAFGPAARLAWTLRDSLSPRDRAAMIALFGRTYPGWTSFTDRLADAERAVELDPDAPSGWRRIGNMQYSLGRYLSDSPLVRRGIGAFDRALALDSSNSFAARARVWAAIDMGDTAVVRRLRGRVEAETSLGQSAGRWRWEFAMALGDSNALAEARSELGRTQNEVTGVGYTTTERGLPYDDWEAATARFEAAAVTDRARLQALEQRRKIAMLQGRSRLALEYADSLIAESWFSWAMHNFVIWEGMFGTGYDSAAAAKAVNLEHLMNEGADLGTGRYSVVCTFGQWKAFIGDREGARDAMQFLEDQVTEYGASPKCPTAIEAILEVETSGGGPAVERFDSLLALDISENYNLLLARIRERQGNYSAALTATRRNAYIGNQVEEPLVHPLMLREEGRLAAIVGDTAGAIRAYEHYLAIRTNPDAAVQPEVDEVRQALAELVGEGRR